ncbi:MAG: tetratricopeptide repeat protein, partial [Clostridia bacterium]|nr:tetratricopeptide repeat protein [Clostridia bacterium]
FFQSKKDKTFKPSKVAIAKNDSIYVISNGDTSGIMEFNQHGVFLRYFGAPDVQPSFSELVSLAWRRIYRSISGDAADKSFITMVPTEFENLVVDDQGFVFSVIAATSETNKDQLMKMNFLGNNILDPNAKSTAKINTTLSETYGDLVRRGTTSEGNIFNDVSVDDDGFITMLDYNLCKIFEYDPDGNMTFVYSGPGYQYGQLRKKGAVALAKLGKKTLILDSFHGAVTVFDLTDYGRTLHNAINYYDQGKYTEAEGLWVDVLKANANCELAHIGIGKVLYQKGDYESALKHYKLANDRTNYQDAYSLYRESLLADNFDFIMTLLLVLVLLIVFVKIFGKKIFAAIKNKREGGADDDDELE